MQESKNNNSSIGQIKSKERVAAHGEVFTNEREVNAMLDLVKQETERLDSRFLEPACGDGNFLIEILRRKLAICESRVKAKQYTQLQYEQNAILAVSSIYGIELLQDNAEACRERLLNYFVEQYQSLFKSKRKEIQEKLIKFATRIPVFMYLTDFREYCLKDVITQLEPELFRKVTGLTLKDFSLLVSLNVFNSELMNDAVYKFKRYEDASLEYTGINTHTGTRIGGWDTVIDTADLVDDEPENEVEEATEPEVEVKPWKRLQVNDEVFHKSLGKGVVKALDDKYIIVNFGREDKKFLFPSIFEREFMFVVPK